MKQNIGGLSVSCYAAAQILVRPAGTDKPEKPIVQLTDEDGLKLVVYDQNVKDYGIQIVRRNRVTPEYHVVEICPYCEYEISLDWSPKDDGMVIYCPKCGKKNMLCDACTHPEDYGLNLSGSCDGWCEKEGVLRD
ncbi:MAG: hypothetical protein IJ926_01280 [Firmicutes bacterium]|nr:hypothetical protein [Bacillota bacterium]